MDYSKLKIASYTYWDLYLHENQCYLGRTFIQLKTTGVDDFLGISGPTRDEFFEIGAHVKKRLQVLFQPDKMNYAALSNTSETIHVHLVPRYKHARHFSGHTFIDTRWGKNYAPYDKSLQYDEKLLFNIRDALILTG